MEEIKPILPAEFIDELKTTDNNNTVDYLTYFTPHINQTINYAIGPYCWFIPDNRAMKIVAASDNIRQLTPFTKEEWIGAGPSFLAGNAHPEDAGFLLAATKFCAEIHERQSPEQNEKIRINIFCRMLDVYSNYRWTLIQYAAQYFNEEGKIESTLALMTDLSSFNVQPKPMMTVIDNNNKEHQYFKVLIDNKSLTPISQPHITCREQEILQLIVKGLNTPQIATKLSISYHTVENHKRNLRKKTDTKTTAELVYFVKVNCLI